MGYFILPRGYFAYRSRSDNDTYVFNRNDCIDKGIISYFYPVFRPKNTDSNFLLRRLNTGMQRQLLIASEGTGQHVLSLKKFKNMKTNFPCIEEQQKVGELFQSLDRTITLHEEKQEQLEQLKKALLQKMFADKTGYPEIKFRGFDEPWDQQKFGAILTTHSFRQYLATPSNNGRYKVIQQGEDPIIGYADGVPFKDYKDVVLFGDHTVSLYKPTAPFFLATDGVKILSSKELTGQYLFAALERYKPNSQGYKRHYSILKDTRMSFTKNREEQKKIGNVFYVIDQILSLHQSKLDYLKELKQALLQQMFI
ncbi:restriction endonuclease subunit S [Lactobacillus equicursoris]|uniref:restriction endonuclease subunit S n=1 Tax=Lactobacillus equicursoris TaxID=420645 RepID=UPI002DD7DA27|nr:restriction endonuclease subunit S [Lactobacillus equicursoris]